MSSRTEWVIQVSDLTKRTNNPIREIVEDLHIEPNPEKPMIALSIGIESEVRVFLDELRFLGDPTVFGNLKPPESVVAAVAKSLESGKYNGYTAACGSEAARTAVATYSKVSPKDVFLCSGASSALEICLASLAGPGKVVLVPKPGFPLYRTLTQSLGAQVEYYNLKPDTGWEVDLTQLDSVISEETCCLVINNPNNPCGSVWSAKHLREILQIAAKYHVPIIADEIYEHMAFPGVSYYSLASLSQNVPILTCSGLTKRFLVPGWRIGWVIIHDPIGVLKEVRQGFYKLCQRAMGCNTIIQGALGDILLRTPLSYYTTLSQTLYDHAILVYQSLSSVNGLQPYMPQGAMYLMVKVDLSAFEDLPTDREFVEKLVSEESVFLLPGACFEAKNFVRIVLAAPIPILKEACQRISQFCLRHRKKVIKTEWLEN